MTDKITFTLNGSETTLEVYTEMLLLDVLRDILDLTGTKHGCDNGTCGACTVVMDGKAVKSCRTTISQVAGRSVVTIEGLAQGMQLHPVQQAMVESGAIQCGFCTPGIVMELYALLESKPQVSLDELSNALNRHLCRCTGYEAIRDGALLAQRLMQR